MQDNTDNDLSARRADGPGHAYLPAGSGQRVWMSGDEYRILLDAAHSAGTMTLLDALVPPAGGPPEHAHADVDELFVVLDGELEIMADGAKYQVGPGGRVFVRRGTPHAFHNRSADPVRMLIFYTPAGVEEFFLAAGVPAQDGLPPPPADEESTARAIEAGLRFQVSQAAQPA
ncbi:cupin domain-containing protein [Chromobacterium subtsugae]|uniref:Cupin domain-containing protein n=1 Tax=Chromobacterium subtsugae TaxID=251747 RepID=A0ABS7F849_9NEIS|nr:MULTISPECIES: cupin domain-containing protein [Chromobacterium]KUM04305.1 hypothetical protein Cv017_15370 [Chromobacterium subtsugae]KZE83315.1 hypothetical protein AWB61_06840 [Chromobacterium sp. F49]MBW7565204.1 cupin domain-containing protein [Chromobacterium subtsugae]MBW8286268.1 cupin domain-containing protein [Chromobacterium subtsugae]WSE91681.1 cupin domain-containing protein [Chromobacterium subtsugae]